MNKVTLSNPNNPRETVTTANMQTARTLRAQGWQPVGANVTTKVEAKK